MSPTIVEPIGGGLALAGTVVIPLPISGHRIFGNANIIAADLLASHGITMDAFLDDADLSASHGLTMTGDVA
jgi:hypothetical protein